jgi:phosphoribosylanthranilate isomerase
MIIQIYAFTDPETARAAAQSGVDHIGFIAGKYGIVNGELDFAEAQEIIAALPSKVVSVALTMSVDVEEIVHMASEVQPDIVHISSDPTYVDVSAMIKLRSRLSYDIRLMKAVPVGDEDSISLAKQFAEVSDLLLLDTQRKGFPGVGATGSTHDWSISCRIVESVSIPVILAGGLTEDNVGAAIRTVMPWGVDSNTSTNLPGDPVKKDLARIDAFVKSVRANE